jgi:hypothetical protein
VTPQPAAPDAAQPPAAQPPAPAAPAETAQAPAATTADPTAGAQVAALTGEGGFSTPGVIGDLMQLPPALVPLTPAQFQAALARQGNPLLDAFGRPRYAIPPPVAAFKIADNEFVRPTDRVFATFNYFNNVNDRVNAALGANIGQLDVYREVVGFEKTFLDRQASVGLRLPVHTLDAEEGFFPGLGGVDTNVGDLSVIFKGLLWEDLSAGTFVSSGLLTTVPTSTSRFGGGDSVLLTPREVLLQPFLGYLFVGERLYLQGFSSIVVPTDSDDATFLFNDLSLGFFAYRSRAAGRVLTALTPIAEVHVNTPLSNRGAFSGPLGVPDSVILTQGVGLELFRRGLLTIGVAEAVTGPKLFDVEAVAQFNWRF